MCVVGMLETFTKYCIQTMEEILAASITNTGATQSAPHCSSLSLSYWSGIWDVCMGCVYVVLVCPGSKSSGGVLNGDKLVSKMVQFFPNIQLSREDVQAVPLVSVTLTL